MIRHLVELKSLSAAAISKLVKDGLTVKRGPELFARTLEGKTLAMLFKKTSTRTRVSFEAAMTQMGGHAQYLDWRTTNFTLGDLNDEIRCLARYVDIIMARVYRHQDVHAMADASSVPVINGLSDFEHPCQILADLMTISEKVGDLRGVKIAYVGDGNNICNSLIVGGAKARAIVAVATPADHKPAADAVAIGNGLGSYVWTEDPKEAVSGAEIVYTDTWISMGDESERDARMKVFPPYQVNAALMSYASSGAYVMHCLPAHRGYEITDEVLDSPQSIVFDQAENRLHIQKAIILNLLGVM